MSGTDVALVAAAGFGLLGSVIALVLTRRAARLSATYADQAVAAAQRAERARQRAERASRG